MVGRSGTWHLQDKNCNTADHGILKVAFSCFNFNSTSFVVTLTIIINDPDKTKSQTLASIFARPTATEKDHNEWFKMFKAEDIHEGNSQCRVPSSRVGQDFINIRVKVRKEEIFHQNVFNLDLLAKGLCTYINFTPDVF
jgi:hypothetical protein